MTLQHTLTGMVSIPRVARSAPSGPERRTGHARALGQWDHIVARTPGADATHLSTWVAPARRAVGLETVYLLAQRDTTVLGGAQVLLEREPTLGAVGSVAYGPLVAPEAPRAEVLSTLADAMAAYARGHLDGLLVQPPDGLEASEALFRAGFRPCSTEFVSGRTVRIDLSARVSLLHAGLSDLARHWLAEAAADGVRVRSGGIDDIDLLVASQGRSTARWPGAPVCREYVDALYRTLAERGRAVVFVAEVGDIPVAARLFTLGGGAIRNTLGGLDRTNPFARTCHLAALDWNAILWARDYDVDEFDMGGLSARAAYLPHRNRARSEHLTETDRYTVAFGGSVRHRPRALELVPSQGVNQVCRHLDRPPRRWPRWFDRDTDGGNREPARRNSMVTALRTASASAARRANAPRPTTPWSADECQ
jgi:hypothetical protein